MSIHFRDLRSPVPSARGQSLSPEAVIRPQPVPEGEEPITYQVRQNENVYSYFTFIIPVEEKKHGSKWTHTKALATILVLVSIIVQSTLLYAILNRIVHKDIKWQNKILNPEGESFGAAPGSASKFLFGAPKSECNPGGSLCTKMNGTVSCAPPSVQLTGRWDELDTNGDGVWLRTEAEEALDVLKCKYSVNPVEVFDAFVTFLQAREAVIWLHPDVKDGKAIPKPYFIYAAGDIIMCLYRSTDMCANVLKMGAFDAPLKYATAPRVGTTIDSALDYCYELLKVGGTCDRTLPSTYAVWRKNGEELCLEADFNKFVYTHPVTGKTKSMLTVDYDARKYYSRAAASELFIVYKTMIIGIFCLALFYELKGCLALINWVLKFPNASQYGEDSVIAVKDEEGSTIRYTVQGISSRHRAIVATIAALRMLMLLVLVYVGLSFLLKDTTYIDLLLNAVGFVFIMEVSEYFYTYLVDAGLKEEVESIDSMAVASLDPPVLANSPALRNMLSLLAITGFVSCVMLLHHTAIVTPLWQALECSCLGEGEMCLEAQKFSKDFWADYWRYQVPGVFADVAAMKRSNQDFAMYNTDAGDEDNSGAIPLMTGPAPGPSPMTMLAPAPGPAARLTVLHHKKSARRRSNEPRDQKLAPGGEADMLNEAEHADNPYAGEVMWSAPKSD